MTSAAARELDWYQASVPGLVALEAPGGHFERVTGDLRSIAQNRRQLFLTSVSSLHGAKSKTGDTRVDHELAALVLWPVNAGGRARLDDIPIEEALAAVVERVATIDHPSHGGRWWMVDDVSVEHPSPLQLLTAGSPDEIAGTSNVRSVRYRVVEWE